MNRVLRTLSIGVLITRLAGASEAFKCTNADGTISFQDKPCAASAREQRFAVPETVDAPLPTPESEGADAAPATAALPATVSPRLAAPDFVLCTRDDGTRYRNDSGHVAVRLVPVEIARPTPRSIGAPASRAPIGGSSGYTQVADECHRAAPDEACQFLRDALKRTDDTIRHSFRDTEAEKSAADLREQLRGCR